MGFHSAAEKSKNQKSKNKAMQTTREKILNAGSKNSNDFYFLFSV